MKRDSAPPAYDGCSLTHKWQRRFAAEAPDTDRPDCKAAPGSPCFAHPSGMPTFDHQERQ